MQARPCPNCGRPLPAQATFCQHCGARFSQGGKAATRPPAPARPASSFSPAGPASASTARARPPTPAQTRPPRPARAQTRPPGSAPARSRLPTQPPGGLSLRQRPGASPPQGESGSQTAPAPKKSNTRLILLLAALVGIIIGATIGVFTLTRKNTPTTSQATPTATLGPIVGMVSFTASGGLQGQFSANLPDATPPASSIQKGANSDVLEVVVNSAALDFELGLSPYPGPGTYNILPFQTNPAPGNSNGTVRISNQQTSWSLHASAQCQVTITSDVSLHRQALGKPLEEVKGSFACPALAADTGSAMPLKITQGLFDVYALVLAS